MQSKRRELMISGISYAILLLFFYFAKFRDSIGILYVALFFFLTALIYPYLFKPLNYIVHPIGRFLINLLIKIILIILFYFIFTPIALIKRVFSSERIIKLGFDKNANSYFEDKPKVVYDREFFKRLY